MFATDRQRGSPIALHYIELGNTVSFSVALYSVIAISAASAQTPQPLKVDGITVSGSLRTRVESWDWFQGAANSDYAFPGSIFRLSLAQSSKAYEWQLEFAVPFVLGLPDDAVAPAPQGQMGFGGTYFAANGNRANAAMLFVKQGYVRFKHLGSIEGQSLKVGRMTLVDGTEVTPANATLAALKRDRVAHRYWAIFHFPMLDEVSMACNIP